MNKFLPYLIILIIIFGLFFSSLSNQFFGDDLHMIFNNSELKSSSFISAAFRGVMSDAAPGAPSRGTFYRPVTMSTLGFLYHLFGENPNGYHLFQISLHAINTLLLFILLNRLFFLLQIKTKQTKFMSLLLSLIFAVHPLNIETVLYIANLSDALSTCFYLLSLILISTNLFKKIEFIQYFVIFSLLFLTFLTKESSITLPLLLGFTYFMVFKKSPLWLVWPSVIAVIFYLLLRFGVARIFGFELSSFPIADTTFGQRLLNIPKEFTTYLYGYFIPSPFPIFQQWVVKQASLKDFYLPLLTIIIFISTNIFFLYKYKNLLLYFFSCWFYLSLLPVLNIIPVDMTVSGRYFYFPQIGLLGIIGILAKNRFVSLLLIIFFFLSSFVTYRNLPWWKTPLLLLTQNYQLNQDSPFLNNYLGFELYKAGNYEDARKHFEMSINSSPKYSVAYTNLANYYLFRKKDEGRAEELYLASIRLNNSFTAYYSLGLLYLRQKRFDKLDHLMEKALAMYPYSPELTKVLIVSYHRSGKNEQAKDLARKLIILEKSENAKYIYTQLMTGQPLEINFRQSFN